MTKAVRRMTVGIACALSFLAAASLPAQAAPTPARTEPAPPPADAPPAFVADACPPLPPDADPAQWTCGNMVFDAGYIRMGRLDQPLTEPVLAFWTSCAREHVLHRHSSGRLAGR